MCWAGGVNLTSFRRVSCALVADSVSQVSSVLDQRFCFVQIRDRPSRLELERLGVLDRNTRHLAPSLVAAAQALDRAQKHDKLDLKVRLSLFVLTSRSFGSLSESRSFCELQFTYVTP